MRKNNSKGITLIALIITIIVMIIIAGISISAVTNYDGIFSGAMRERTNVEELQSSTEQEINTLYENLQQNIQY